MTITATREDTWLSIAQAADQLGVHARTLRRYIRDGKLQVLRLSPQVVRIRPEDLEKFLAENIKVNTGTGTCYVPQPETPIAPTGLPTPGKPARYTG